MRVRGIAAHLLGWKAVLGLLTILGSATFLCIVCYLLENHLNCRALLQHPWKKAFNILKGKRVLTYGWLVAECNGVTFSFYAEGPFYYISALGLTPFIYGAVALGIALPLFLGASCSHWPLIKGHHTHAIIRIGCICMLARSSILSVGIIQTLLVLPSHPKP